jgi:hypothetical protein
MALASDTTLQEQYRTLHKQGLTNKDMMPILCVCYTVVRDIGRAVGLTPNGGSGWGGKRANHRGRLSLKNPVA